MKFLSNILKRFVQDTNGLETVEYAIIAALITGGAIIAITSLGGAVATRFSDLVTKLG